MSNVEALPVELSSLRVVGRGRGRLSAAATRRSKQLAELLERADYKLTQFSDIYDLAAAAAAWSAPCSSWRYRPGSRQPTSTRRRSPG
jgi:hypothetical protein